MDVRLNFINHSNDANNTQIAIFGKNAGSGANELAVAWKVIQNCGAEWNHPFTYPMTSQAGAADSYGNYSPRLDAQPGQAFAVNRGASGDMIGAAGEANYPTEIQILNNLPMGAINACIFKAGSLYAIRTSVAPQQMAAFEFRPTIWIGAVSQVTEGAVMNSAIVDQVNTEISLLGIASADIVMTGGGPGRDSQPFQFTLQNVVYA